MDTTKTRRILNAMGPRAWAAIGNYYKINAAFLVVAGTLLGARAIDANQHGASSQFVLPIAALTVTSFAIAALLWNVRGFLIRGNLIARVLFGVPVLLSVIFSLGLALIWPFGVIYLFTGEPAAYEYYGFRGKSKEPPPRFKAPANWQASGRVGPSGAMLYRDPARTELTGIFDSYTPVQVVDRQNGLAHVVAATGQGGWIDLRTLTEGV